RVARGAGRRVRPGQRRRDVLAHAIGVLLVVAGILDGELAVILESRRFEHERVGRLRAASTQKRQRSRTRNDEIPNRVPHDIPPLVLVIDPAKRSGLPVGPGSRPTYTAAASGAPPRCARQGCRGSMGGDGINPRYAAY